MRYVFHREALAEYEEAAVYYAAIDPQLASRFVEAIEQAVDLVAETPLRWIDVDDGIRRCMARVFPYAVLYSIEADYVLIVAVMHCSREPGYWKQRIGSQLTDESL